MKTLFVVCLILAACSASNVSIQEALAAIEELILTNATFADLVTQDLINHQQLTLQTRVAPSSFNCPVFHTQNSPPTVHQLRASDFKVVGALGDSLTAGNGILSSSVFDVTTNYRGRSWSIGGDHNLDQVVTLPNILREYNRDLKGFSTGTGDYTSSGANLNVAHEGDTSHDMPYQAGILVDRIRAMHNVDFNTDWKLVTLFIGGNDLCGLCDDPTGHAPATYISKIREALDILHRNLPHAFVNVVEIFDITPIIHMNGGFLCSIVQDMVCDCARNVANEAWLKDTARGYQTELQALVASGRYDTKSDFTVVLQSFFRDTVPPNDHTGSPDLSYFAPDCFHFSEKGQQVGALSLWNGMWEPVGGKRTTWHNNMAYTCPSEFDYVPTASN